MRGYILIVSLLLLVNEMSAQCTAYLSLGGFSATLTAEFIAEGAVNPQYIIDWGDGTVDTSSTPLLEHQYISEGFYLITYTYQDLDSPGCSYTSVDSVIITGGACSLNFNLQTNSYAALVQAFSFNTSLPIYTINWGDGSPEEVAQTALHAYAVPGVYEICVSMYDADPSLPCELSQCQQVEITGDGTSCPVDLQLDPVDMSVVATITAGGGPNAGYFIDWGDGNFDVSPVTEHTYANEGTYQVCVYYGVANNTECQSTACAEVIIDPLGDCYFDFIATINELDVELQVLAAGADNPAFYFDWGDGTFGESTLPPVHSYSEPGNYEICGSYSDANNPAGCQLASCIVVTINTSSGGCSVDLSVTQTGSDVSITATGEGAVEPTYFVEWGDGSLPLLASSGAHTYGNAGAFGICVTYGDATNESCSATTCETVVITEIENVESATGIHAWPIPMKDLLLIELPSGFSGCPEMNLYDMAGRLILADSEVKSFSSGIWMVDVKTLPIGCYVLECTTLQGVTAIRLLK